MLKLKPCTFRQAQAFVLRGGCVTEKPGELTGQGNDTNKWNYHLGK